MGNVSIAGAVPAQTVDTHEIRRRTCDWNTELRRALIATAYSMPLLESRVGLSFTMAGKTKRQRQNAHREFRRAPGTAPRTLNEQFGTFAQTVAHATGHPTAFLLALALVAVWIVSGPIFQYSDTWQLVINTGTTIVTFLMVFLIQNTQNRGSMAVQLKLSELVLAAKGAENKFAAIEDLSDDELEQLHDECRARAEMTLHHLRRRRSRRGRNGHQRRRTPLPRTQPSRRSSPHASRP